MKNTKETFIEKARKVHGNKYDYSKLVYKTVNDKMEIICPTHGSFWQNGNNHLHGRGCPKCGRELQQNKVQLTTEEFIRKSTKIHNGYYNYSKVVYNGSFDKVCIICPVHGEFYEQPRKHLEGHGCSLCALDSKKKGLKTFIEEAQRVHGNKYDYSQSTYISRHSKIKIICPIHGEFWQRAAAHLSGEGCPSCSASKGEAAINNYLKEKNIKFTSQKKFSWLLSTKASPLKLDFYIEDYNFAIEFQGRQHFIPVNWSGNLSETELKGQLKEVQERDDLKSKLLLEHGINVYYINYDEDIKSKLDQIFSKYSYIDKLIWKAKKIGNKILSLFKR